MEYFELPQLRVDKSAHIEAIDSLKGNFKSVDLNYDGHQVTYEKGVPTDKMKMNGNTIKIKITVQRLVLWFRT